MRLFLFFLVFAVSCKTTPKETKAGKKVNVIKEISDPYACSQLGKTKYDGTPFINEAELTTIGKEMAAEMKGNTVRFDVFEPGINGVRSAKLRATVYRCKTTTPPSGTEVVPAKASGTKGASAPAAKTTAPKASKTATKGATPAAQGPVSPAEDSSLPPTPE